MLPPASEKFCDIDLDVVGPLQKVKGMRYLLTVVDRFSRWTMAELMANQLASTLADTFIRGWIQHHGVPHSITTYRGTNFQSSLFQTLLAPTDAATFTQPHSIRSTMAWWKDGISLKMH